MTSTALWSIGLASHFLGIHVLLMRETFDSELTHLRGETDSGSLGVHRRFMTYDAHLTGGARKILGMAFDTSRVAWKYRRYAVIQTLMAEGAILCFCLMFGSRMNEWRRAIDHRGLFYVER
jgi:hypothetical protein